jgi:large subunit ribosomal protein L3
MAGLIGKKLGMTQVYNDKDELVPVTVVAAGPCPIVMVKSAAAHGYDAVQVAFDQIAERRVTKPVAGQFAKAKVAAHRIVRELRGEAGQFERGQVLDVDQFQVGDVVKVSGRSKGKGFAGVIKRHGFHGKDKAHGTPDRVRHPGAIGQGTTPGRVWRGKRMSGHMGNRRVTVGGLSVVRVDPERHLLFIRGAVPGGANGYLTIVKA